MEKLIRVAILDDHQSIIDGYLHRLSQDLEIVIVGYACYGQDLYEILYQHLIDVLILDISVPLSPNEKEPYPVISQIPNILDKFPQLYILVISIYHQPTLIEAVIDAGASGFILKDDSDSIQSLPEIVKAVAQGENYLSPAAEKKLARKIHGDPFPSARQLEVLSLCATYPEATSSELAQRMQIAPSTFRNLLSRAYVHLGAKNRTEAILKARRMGILISVELTGL